MCSASRSDVSSFKIPYIIWFSTFSATTEVSRYYKISISVISDYLKSNKPLVSLFLKTHEILFSTIVNYLFWLYLSDLIIREYIRKSHFFFFYFFVLGICSLIDIFCIMRYRREFRRVMLASTEMKKRILWPNLRDIFTKYREQNPWIRLNFIHPQNLPVTRGIPGRLHAWSLFCFRKLIFLGIRRLLWYLSSSLSGCITIVL